VSPDPTDPAELRIVESAHGEETAGGFSDGGDGRSESSFALQSGVQFGAGRPVPGEPEDQGPGPDGVKGPDGGERRSRRKRWLVEWIVVLVFALVVALVVRAYVVQTFFIPSGSMEPTLQIGDRILVDKLSYHLHAVHRGDIVVFRRPPGVMLPSDINDLVKRVIGLPGDVISSSDGHVVIDGKVLKEPWLPAGVVTQNIHGGIPGCLPAPDACKVPPGDYFVMGDNRTDSDDSRMFGPISRSLIVGRVVMRVWPLSRIGFF
jgi:signal peptidase I